MVTKASKAKGLSLHTGLNLVSGAHYGGWTGELSACEFDANDMAALARGQGLKPTVLLTKKATRAAVLASIRAAAKSLKSGDLFFLSYSGHGGQVPDVTGEESDKQDETWCLYDGQLIDDELYAELGRFAKGVRVLVLSDSCHSGTVTRAAPPPPGAAAPAKSRMMPPAVAMRTYRDHQAFYDKLQRDVARADGGRPADPDAALAQLAVSPRLTALAAQLKAAVILVSGCQDNQTSLDGEHNGAFTERLLMVWNQGKFEGNYASFHAQIKARMPASQTPNLFVLGPAAAFLRQRPFKL
ncbi:caspase family protein [Methylibium sp.]|uniref:caspase family protein n=1 Tax=Methylibium sp. TaxID=2067992 RepID=UPI003D13C69A